MGAELKITTLGKPQIEYAGHLLHTDLITAKGQALLIYLAVSGQAHSRAALAGLLWGDMPEETARANLRLTLSRLRKGVEAYLDVTRHEIRFRAERPYWLDVEEIANLGLTISLYRGDFLEDFTIPNAPDFEMWVLVERERWRETAVSALLTLTQAARQHDDFQSGIQAARKLLTIEPWHEEAHRHLIWLLAASGQRSAALAQYETCRRLLAEELGIEPAAETAALRDEVIRGAMVSWPPTATSRGDEVTPTLLPTHPLTPSLPQSLTPFIGRKTELERLGRQLQEPTCRLLTLVGMGGMGKTRLAIELAAASAPHFTDGVYFVDLAPLQGAALLATAVTDALHLPLNSSGSPEKQLSQYLAPHHMLLVLDNFESVLEGATFLADLLMAAPRLTLLVTSREPLELSGEWLYPLQGLAFPGETADTDAVHFFASCARRVRPDFSLEAEQAGVVAVCQAVAGMPLALELAATWMKTLTAADIAAEIRHNLDILSVQRRNQPERHRSVQAILDQTWQRLTPEEQDTFARLTVFQGPFDRAAAQQTAGADLPILASLLDKSLLHRQVSGRYSLHPLVRQYGYGRLLETAVLTQTEATYADYFADFCQERLPQLLKRDRATLAELKREQDNIRAVWDWAVARRQAAVLDRMAQPFAIYLTHFSYNQEHFYRFDTAVKAMADQTDSVARRVQAYALLEMGNAHMAVGKLSDADQALQASEQLYEELGIAHAPGLSTDPLLIRSIVAWMRSDFASAVQFGEKGLQRARAEQNQHNQAYGHFVLSGANVALGGYEKAREHAQQAFDLMQALGDSWFLAYCHIELGKAAQALADYGTAERHFETAFALRQAFENPTGMGMARLMLGECQRRQGKWADAQRSFTEARTIYEEIHNQMGLSRAFAGLGDVATGQGQYEQARGLHAAGLALVVEAGLQTYANTVLVGVGEWLCAVGQRERALEVLTAVAHDRRVSVELKERALRLLPPSALETDAPITDTLQLAAALAAEL